MLKQISILLIGITIAGYATAMAEGPRVYVRTEQLNIKKKNRDMTAIGIINRVNLTTDISSDYLLRFWRKKGIILDSFCLDTLKIQDLNKLNELNNDLSKKINIKYISATVTKPDVIFELTVDGIVYEHKLEQYTPNIWSYTKCEW